MLLKAQETFLSSLFQWRKIFRIAAAWFASALREKIRFSPSQLTPV
jgi:hypothetical protein